MKDLAPELAQRRERHLYRTRIAIEGPQDTIVTIDGRSYLAFCSNDYLGLASHPAVVAALREGAERFGVGSGAAHLVSGHTAAHHALEEELAEFVQRQHAVLFSTGYMANLGIVQALAGRGDRVFEDYANHASLLDAAQLSRAKLVRYRHKDSFDLEKRLLQASGGEYLVLTDGIFSMDGDQAPLDELSAVASRHGAWLVVDDAHGLGVCGPDGRGSAAQQGLGVEQVPVMMGTVGKAIGTFGAFVAGDADLVETLIQQARTYVYTTAPPPAVAWATRRALKLLVEESWRRERLQALIQRFRDGADDLGLPVSESATPIQPLIIGSPDRALAISEDLRASGILITAIRPPTVPEGSARLRITLSANHREEDIDRLLEAVFGACQQRGLSA